MGGACSSQGRRMEYRSIAASKSEKSRPPEITFKLMSKVQNIRTQSQFESTKMGIDRL